MKKALITGITGQDGSYLAEFLLSKGYEVHGLIRRSSSFNTERIDHLYLDPHNTDVRLFLHHGDLSDSGQITNLIYNIQPNEIYHLAAKVYAYWMAVNYRDGYNIFACNGILFNHESPRRGETFVTRKITRAIANILGGRQQKLYLGNLEAKRDWGFAPEYVMCQWLMLQQDRPEDYIIGTGESHTVREFLELAFDYVGIEIEWKGKGIHQKGIIKSLD